MVEAQQQERWWLCRGAVLCSEGSGQCSHAPLHVWSLLSGLRLLGPRPSPVCDPLGWSRTVCPEAFPKHISLGLHDWIFSRVFIKNNPTGLWQVMESPNPSGSDPNTSRFPLLPLLPTLCLPCCCLTPLMGSELVQSLGSSRGQSSEQ